MCRYSTLSLLRNSSPSRQANSEGPHMAVGNIKKTKVKCLTIVVLFDKREFPSSALSLRLRWPGRQVAPGTTEKQEAKFLLSSCFRKIL